MKKLSRIALSFGIGFFLMAKAHAFPIQHIIVAESTQTMTGILSVKGTNTNATPGDGMVGQIASTATAASTSFPTSTTYGDLVSTTVAAGHWLFAGSVSISTNGATVPFAVIGALSTAGDNPPPAGMCRNDTLGITNTGDDTVTWTFSNCEFKLSATTTIYLKYRANYSVATPKASGTLFGVRLP